MFREALEQADQKDKEYRATGQAEGAFWGLPSTFKGQLPSGLVAVAFG
jgi:hypothetical protein